MELSNNISHFVILSACEGSLRHPERMRRIS